MIFDTAAFRFVVRQPTPVLPHGGAAGLHVCRAVFDPDDDLSGGEESLSAIGRSIAAGMRRGVTTDAHGQLTRARALVADGPVQLVEMDDADLRLWSAVTAEANKSLPVGLSSAAAATIAIARRRSWTVVSADPDVIRFLNECGAQVVELDSP